MAVNSPYQDFLTWYQNSDYYKQELAERQQAADWERRVYGDQQAYQNAELAQRGDISRAQIGASRDNAKLAASTNVKTQKMQIDANYRQFKEQLEALGIPTLQLDAWYRQQQVGLAKAELALKASGPRNALQYSSAMGRASGSLMPASLQALARNQQYTPGAPGGTPEKFNLDDYLSGRSQNYDADRAREDAVRAGLRDVIARGPGGVAPGVYESMPMYDQEIFKSALGDAGYDPEDWLQRRAMGGIGQ